MRVALGIALATLLFAGFPVAAQDMQGPSWEMGWVTDVDPKYLVELEEDWDLGGSLVVYVSNEGPAELNLALSYDDDEDDPFIFDGPDSISVAGNTNDTFTISISGASAEEVRSFSPSSSIEFTVIGEEKVGESTLRTQEIQADVSVPRMYRLVPEAIQPSDTLFAGSWVDFSLEVSNLGNTQDAITTGEATVRSCPHLSVAGLDQLENQVVAVTTESGENKAQFTLRLEASSSHQERTCEVSLSVKSEGDGTERSTTINVDVKAPKAEEEVLSEDEEEDDPVLPDSSSLVWLAPVEMMMLISVVLLVVNRRINEA
ncbi:MAG: hypothetical protein QF531_01825 [Candidatus Poseidonia sp.]|jgi:hypothetical protein|nr:hypothetical protein [Poseidonia sp.]